MHRCNFARTFTRLKGLPIYGQKRYKQRYKQQWAMSERKKSPTQLALSHFDLHYPPVYESEWPSVRIALLSKSKHCALVNNFVPDRNEIDTSLAELGAHDFVWTARSKLMSRQMNAVSSDMMPTDYMVENADSTRAQVEYGTEDDIAASDGTASDSDELEDQAEADDSSVVNEYMPVTRIVSDKEQKKQDELHQNIYRADPAVQIETVPAAIYNIPVHLAAFAFDVGDISSFPNPRKTESNKLGYYPMDGSSVLPVIALDLEPDSDVLDLCAAPGGKSLTILQTLLPGRLTCVDESRGRLRRLKEVMECYLPSSYLDDGKIRIIRGNGAAFAEEEALRGNRYDRVLVDVPCYTDRHVLNEPENNLFQTSRVSERLELSQLQQELLYAGCRACRPGGIIVYSTCTLSPVQNDGVVAAALERVWMNTHIEVVVEDIRDSLGCFTPMFKFFDHCKYGSLVLPNLVSNFGPMYFCRLRRIS